MGLFVPTDYPANAKTSSYEFKTWMADTYKFVAAIYNFIAVNSSYGASVNDYIISVDCSGGSVTITLPDPRDVVSKKYILVRADNSTNDILVATRNNQNVEGAAATLTIPQNRLPRAGKSKTFISLGDQGWWIMGSVNGIFETSGGELAD